MNINHSLKNRLMHVDNLLEEEEGQKVQSANEVISKCKNCTLDELAILQVIKDNPSITQKELAVRIGKSERTLKTKTVELQEKGYLQRVNGKRNGQWKVIINEK